MKYDLSDITFLFIVRLDTIERLENTLISSSFILKYFKTNIVVWEISEYCNGCLKTLLDSKIKYNFIQEDDPILHRTKYLNRMMEVVTTPFVSIWDVDVIVHPEQIKASMEILRSKKAEFVYPYTDTFLDTSFILRKLFIKNDLDINILLMNQNKMFVLYKPNPVGGAFLCNVDSYKRSGLENEKFYGWGVEDGERYRRWRKNGFLIERATGPLFHLTHPRGMNSSAPHPDQLITKRRLLNITGNIT